MISELGPPWGPGVLFVAYRGGPGRGGFHGFQELLGEEPGSTPIPPLRSLAPRWRAGWFPEGSACLQSTSSHPVGQWGCQWPGYSAEKDPTPEIPPLPVVPMAVEREAGE